MQDREIFTLLVEEYRLELVSTPSQYAEVKAIRKEVYAQKYGKPAQYLNDIGLISDPDDAQSFIYLLKERATQRYVGTVRNFFINSQTPSQRLPLQQTVQDQHPNSFYTTLPVTEISRLALMRHTSCSMTLSTLRLRTLLTYGLMVATRLNLFLYPSTRVFALMEPALHRILRRQKVCFSPLSLPINRYGILRIPYAIETTRLLQETEETMGAITRHYLRELCQNPESFWQFIDNNPYLDRSDIQLERICKLFDRYGENVDLTLLLGETSEPSTA